MLDRFRHQPKEYDPEVESRIQVLQKLDNPYKGWTTTNEDHLLLLEGLKGIKRPGGFFGVGEFQVLDIALQLDSDVIVLGDLDRRAVEKNLAILRIVERSHSVEEVLPKILALIEQLDGKNIHRALQKKLTLEGDQTGSRVKLAWATDKKTYEHLKELIRQGRVAVAQVDVTNPSTMDVVQTFFRSHNKKLNTAYLSNTISHTTYNSEIAAKHQRAVRALRSAGGHEKTLIIRSGPSTDREVTQKAYSAAELPPESFDNILAEDRRDRAAHYGQNIKILPENIPRVVNDMYAFEFFIQELGQYAQHARKLK